MHHIVVVFRDDDLLVFSNKLNDNSIILGEVSNKLKKGKQIKPHLDIESEKILSASVKMSIQELEENLEIDSLMGFANNLYECSVAPLAAYIKTLDETIKTLKKTQDSVEVWFPTRFLMASKSSAYYLAEHETQGKKLYSREATYIKYLEEVCKKNKVKIKYEKLSTGLNAIVQRVARIFCVQAVVLIKSIINSFREREYHSTHQNNNPELIVVTRSIGQTETILPFLQKSEINTLLIAAETRMGGGKNKNLIKDCVIKNKNIEYKIIKFSTKKIIFLNIRALRLMLLKPNFTIEFCNVIIDLNQALTEILVLWPDYILYREELLKKIKSITNSELNILLSMEQKSPYAHADAWVAKKIKIKCMHVMQCDQIARPLPNPVAGDYFLPDSKKNERLFLKAWDCRKDSVKYIGSFKAINSDYKFYNLNNIKNENRWCFFAAMDDHINNISILRELRKIKNKNKLEIIVKLHPRDNVRNYSEFYDFEFIKDGLTRKNTLFSAFDFAISYNSGVMLDLIYQEKPYLHLRLGKWYTNTLIYSNDKYFGNIDKIEELEYKMEMLKSKKEDFKLYRNDFLDENKIENNVNFIKINLINMSKKNEHSK